MTDNFPVPPGAADPPPDPPPDPPDAPPPGRLVRAATRMRQLLSDNTGLLAVTFLTNLVVIFGTGAVWYARGGDTSLVGGVVGALLLLSSSMLSLIRGRGQADAEKPLWPPLMLLVVPVAVLAVGLPALGWSIYRDTRPVDLTHEFELTPSGPFEQGMTVIAKAHTGHPKSRLFITFAASEYDPESPVCAPSSRLHVALRSGPQRGGPQTGRPGEEFTFELGRNHQDIRLAVRMTAEPNCALDLSVASARVDD
ncbi:hypothetical protein [Streptomyces sp. NPDC059009]|uniref:hypothetical protein n=1 Tax=Streptomyces sp. NPDC059009 TaxID=3346694 RepID=UPI0036B3D9C3